MKLVGAILFFCIFGEIKTIINKEECPENSENQKITTLTFSNISDSVVVTFSDSVIFAYNFMSENKGLHRTYNIDNSFFQETDEIKICLVNSDLFLNIHPDDNYRWIDFYYSKKYTSYLNYRNKVLISQ